MQEIGLSTRPFTESALFSALANDHFDLAEVQGHDRARYLFSYLAKLQAKSIVVETPYTDADYLEDFASYYVRCHTCYDSRCKRLHFFSCDLPDGWYPSSAALPHLDSLQSAYLGFIVARPLPDSIIGRTVLRTYDHDSGRRDYPATLDYEVHLCGLTLRVERTLAFQEQDTVLAACATVALWSCFQKTSHLFHTPVPSPSAITRAATRFTHHSRPIPSHGLLVTEICAAIRHIGLEPELFRIDGRLPLASLLYGYLNMGLPVILGVKQAGRGGHAIALAGYSKQAGRVKSAELGGVVPMCGLRIDALYGHDDQAGPFSRLSIEPAAGNSSDVLTSKGYTDQLTGALIELIPSVVIVPVYHKLRITFTDIQEWLSRLHRLFEVALKDRELEWDVRLCTSNRYKADLLNSHDVPNGAREAGLRLHLPKFLWRATLHSAGQAGADLLFDATGLARTSPLLSAMWFAEGLASKVEEILNSQDLAGIADLLLTPRVVRLLNVSLAERNTRRR